MFVDLYDFVVRNQVIYLLGVVSIVFSLVLRNVRNSEVKKWMSSLWGLYLYIHLLQEDFLYFFVLMNILILTILVFKSRSLVITMFIALTYSSVYRYVNAETILDLHSTRVLVYMYFTSRMTGLAFDTNETHNKINTEKKDGFYEHDYETNPSIMDIYHFSFCHIGLIGGHFYRFRTYEDYMNGTFAAYAPFKNYMLQRFFVLFFFQPIYIMVHRNLFPFTHMFTEEFHECGFWYKLFYGLMQGVAYQLWMYSVFSIREVECGAAGMGAYPVQAKSVTGHGPTKNYKKIRNMSEEELKAQKYDFETIRCLNLYSAIFSPWAKVLIDSWNMTLTYWMSYMVYTRLSKSKNFKKHAFLLTMIINLIWHGLSSAFYFAAFYIAVLILSMRDYWKILTYVDKKYANVYLVVIWLLRQFFISIFGLVFQQYFIEHTYVYFKTVYFVPIFFQIILYFVGKSLLSYLKSNEVKTTSSTMGRKKTQ